MKSLTSTYFYPGPLPVSDIQQYSHTPGSNIQQHSHKQLLTFHFSSASCSIYPTSYLSFFICLLLYLSIPTSYLSFFICLLLYLSIPTSYLSFFICVLLYLSIPTSYLSFFICLLLYLSKPTSYLSFFICLLLYLPIPTSYLSFFICLLLYLSKPTSYLSFFICLLLYLSIPTSHLSFCIRLLLYLSKPTSYLSFFICLLLYLSIPTSYLSFFICLLLYLSILHSSKCTPTNKRGQRWRCPWWRVLMHRAIKWLLTTLFFLLLDWWSLTCYAFISFKKHTPAPNSACVAPTSGCPESFISYNIVYMCIYYVYTFIYQHSLRWHDGTHVARYFPIQKACVHTCIGLAKTIYIRCIYGNFGREITKYTVI